MFRNFAPSFRGFSPERKPRTKSGDNTNNKTDTKYKLEIRVVEVKGIKPFETDEKLKHDVFIKLKLGNIKNITECRKKTTDIKWNEHLTFNNVEDPQHSQSQELQIYLCERDAENEVSAVLGQASIQISNLTHNKKVNKLVNLKAENEGKQKKEKGEEIIGKIKLEIRACLEREEGIHDSSRREETDVASHKKGHGSVVQIKVYKARNLRSADRNGKSDPYCILKIGKEKQKTKKLKSTLNPEWNESFTFGKKGAKSKSINVMKDVLSIDVYDDDGYFGDDLLGNLTINLQEASNSQKTWYPLRKKKGSKELAKGEILLEVTIDNGSPKNIYSSSLPERELESDHMEQLERLELEEKSECNSEEEQDTTIPKQTKIIINVLKATGLLVKDRRNGTSDPYCILRVGKERHKTKVIKKSLDPNWNETFTFGQQKNNGIKDDSVLRLEVRDKDLITSDNLGEASISILDLYNDYQKGIDTHWITLDSDENSQVQVSIEFAFGKEEAQNKKRHLTVSKNKRDIEELVLEISNNIKSARRRNKNAGFDVKSTFELYDKDNSGKITADELKEMLELMDLAPNISKEEMEELINTFDVDGDGQVDYTEFLEVMEGNDENTEAGSRDSSLAAICHKIFTQRNNSRQLISCLQKLEKALVCFDMNSTGAIQIGKLNRGIELSGGTAIKSEQDQNEILKNFPASLNSEEYLQLLNYKGFCHYLKTLLLANEEAQNQESRISTEEGGKDVALQKGTAIRLRIVKAEGLRAADWNGKSDPFCILTFGKKKYKSKVIKKTLNPEWNEEFVFREANESGLLESSDYIEITVKDKDLMFDDVLGTVKIPVSKAQSNGTEWYSLSGKKAKGRILIQTLFEQKITSTSDEDRDAELTSNDQIYNPSESVLETTKTQAHKQINGIITSDSISDKRNAPPSNSAKTNGLKEIQRKVTRAMRTHRGIFSLRDVFEKADKKHKGWLSCETFKLQLQLQNIHLTRSDLDILLPRIDPEDKNKLDYTLFCRLMGVQGISSSSVREKLKHAIAASKTKNITLAALFNLFDTRHRGLLKKDAFIQALGMLDIDLDDHDVERISEIVHIEQNGLIPYADLFQGIDPDIHIQVSGNDELTVEGTLRYIRNVMQKKLITDARKGAGENTNKDLLSMFEEMDRNGDGKVNKKEFRKIIKQFKVLLSEKQLSALEEYFDSQGEGKFDYCEFISMVGEVDKKNIDKLLKRLSDTLRGRDQSLARAFDRHDMNGDGKIPRRRFRRILGTIDHDLNAFELRSLMDYLDPHGLGFISVSKFFSCLGMDQNLNDDAFIASGPKVTKDTNTSSNMVIPYTATGYGSYDFAATTLFQRHRFDFRALQNSLDPWSASSIQEWLENGATPSERSDFDRLYRSVTDFSTNIDLNHRNLKHPGSTSSRRGRPILRSPVYPKWHGKHMSPRNNTTRNQRSSPTRSICSPRVCAGRKHTAERASPSPSYRNVPRIGWECTSCFSVNRNLENLNFCGICHAKRETTARVFGSQQREEYDTDSSYSYSSSSEKKQRKNKRRNTKVRRRRSRSKYDSYYDSTSSDSSYETSSSRENHNVRTARRTERRNYPRHPYVPKKYVIDGTRGANEYFPSSSASSTSSSSSSSENDSDSDYEYSNRRRNKSRIRNQKHSARSRKSTSNSRYRSSKTSHRSRRRNI